jgi:uncharacterized delta-60 repeat protein
LLAVLLIPAAQATPGALDPTFGTGGKVTTAIGADDASASALALQPDGKLVAAGGSKNGSIYLFALARYNPNGSLDTSFNDTGTVTTAIGDDGDDVAYALALQPDGKLVAAGFSFNYQTGARVFALVRYNPSGSLDTSFGGTGKVTTAIGGDNAAYALALQPDGELVAAGESWRDGRTKFALARYRDVTLVCVVPKLKGKTLRAAKLAIRKASCSVGKVTKAFSATVKKGRVIYQTPKPGKKLATGAKVKLKASKGRRP